jgi:predicted PurR-regulated permease PerM
MAEHPVPKFFLALIILAAALLALVIAPVAEELVVAAVFADVLWPAMQWLSKRLRDKRGIAAGLITFTVILLLLGPVATMVTYVVRDGADAVHFISDAARSEDVAALVGRLPESARNMIENAIDRLPRNIDELMIAMEGHEGEAVSTVRKAVTATGSFAFAMALTLIALFFLLVRGKELVEWLEGASPLGRGQTAELFTTFQKVSYSVVVASAATAAVQAIAALIGYLIVRVPSP